MQFSVNGKQFQIGSSLHGHIKTSIRQAAEKYFEHSIDATVTMSRGAGSIRVDLDPCRTPDYDPWTGTVERALCGL
jgi:ribosome-associated translation inhibitor RaiA